MIHKVKAATRHFCFGLLIVTAIGLSFIRLFFLSVDDYKSQLQSKIYELTKIPVQIGTLGANMRGFNPEIVLKNIHVLSTDNTKEHPVKLEQLRLGISLMDLILTRQVLPSSWVTLVGVELSIVRNEDGTLSIEGLNSDESEQPFWLLNGGRYEVLKSEITWLDNQRNADPVTFNSIDLLIENDADTGQHDIHLITQLPDKMGESLRLSMSIQGDVFEKDNINGLVYIKGSDIQLTELMTGELPSDLKLISGQGDFELWSQWERSKNVALTGSVQVKDIRIQKQKQVFTVDAVGAQLSVFNHLSGWQVGVTDFKAKKAGKEWPALSFNAAVNHELTQIATSIGVMDLQELLEFSRFFAPLDKQQKQLILNSGLKGQIKDFSAYIDLEKKSYAVNGQFQNVFTAAFADYPQIENLSGFIKGTNDHGEVSLNTQQASLFYPHLFRRPFSIHKLQGLLTWQQQTGKLLIAAENLVLNIKDAETNSKLALIIPDNSGPVFMDLQSSFSKLNDVSVIPQYYPETIMSKDTLKWLDDAFVSGKIDQGRLLVYGELNQFPYMEGQGVFEVLLDATELELQVSPDWPHLTGLEAEILFEKESLTVAATQAKMHGMHITQTLVEIPSFSNSNYLLAKGLAEGELAEGLKFLQQTPLREEVDQFLDAVSATGEIKIELDFKVPLIDGLDEDVDGVAHLKNAALNIKAVGLNIKALEGDLKFTEKGLFAKNITAKTLANPIIINVDSDDTKTLVSVNGKASVKQLKKSFSFLDSELLAQGRLKGATNYQVKLELPSAASESAKLNIETNLKGISLGLPGLLNKTAEHNKELLLSLLLNNENLLPISLNYNNEIKVAMNIDKQQNELHSAHIVYGQGLAKRPKEKGIKIQVDKASFNLAEWISILPASNHSQQKPAQRLNEISIVTKDLQWEKNHYGRFEIAGKRFGEKWQGNLSCSAAKGAFIIPIDHSDKDKIKLQMAYINLSELMQLKIQSDGFSSENLPLINVQSDQLWWNTTNLGVLEIDTERIGEGVRFKKITVATNDHKIDMHADWIKQGKGSFTDLYGTLTSNDMGMFLTGLGLSNDLKEASASIDFSGRWPSSPYQFSLADVTAEVDLKLEDGRISSIEPGFGRVLGLIAMEQWVKRLTLDFSDLYKKGLSFNTITAIFKLDKGKAQTTDLLVDAIPAQISITGEADLLDETLDHSIFVVPKSSGALPIAGTIVSRIAGTITQAVTNDYEEGYFFGSKYQVTGKWDDIKVKSLHEEDGIIKKTWTGLTDFSWMAP